MQTWRREFPGSLASIAEAAKWVDQIATEQNLPSDKTYALRVCAEEVLTNIVRHGGLPSPQIEITIGLYPDRIELIVEDDGKPFDVSASTPRRVGQPLEDATIGGLGIQLINSFSDRLSYSRAIEKNRVVVEFILPELVRPGLEPPR
jgi:anti-sigma regulatory factor (Ser/Thr protein kinase)